MRLVKTLTLLIAIVVLSACTSTAVLVLNKVNLTELSVQGDKLYVMNELNSKSFKQVKKTVEKNPQIETLVFTAMPGSFDDEVTFAMGRWLREQGLNTHLTAKSVIASGAVDLFLAGNKRTMERGAQIGVHSWFDGSKEASEFPKDDIAHALNKNYIIDMGVPEAFYWFTIYQAPADGIYWMNETEIAQYGLTTMPEIRLDSSSSIPFSDFYVVRREVLTN
jgi:beta-lactamase class D